MQNLNLYQPEKRVERHGPQPRQLLVGLAVILAAMSLHGAWEAWAWWQQRAATTEAERAAKAAEDQLANATAAFKEPVLDPELPRQLSQLQSDNQQLARMKDYLSLLDRQQSGGFAAPLRALAERHPAEGLWLTDISLHEGGMDMSLKGRSQTKEILPDYLQSLGRSEVFSGRQFAGFIVQREESGVLAFQLDSRARKEGK